MRYEPAMVWILAYYLLYWALAAWADKGSAQALRVSQFGCPEHAPWPGISVLKPLRGGTILQSDLLAREEALLCFSSWMKQDYPGPIQLIFSLQDPHDPALPLLEELRVKYPFELIIHPVQPGFNGKMSNLLNASLRADHEILVLSDADIESEPSALRRIVARILEPGESIVSCIPLHDRARGTPARIYAAIWNRAILWFWAPAMLGAHAPGVAGGTIGLRRSTLERIGGLAGFSDRVAEDIAMGMSARRNGIALRLGPPVRSPVGRMGWSELRHKLLRASLVAWTSNPGGRMATLALYTFSAGYTAILGCSLYSGAWGKVAISLLFILGLGLLVGRLERRITGRFRFPLEVVLLDLCMVASFISAVVWPRMSWGGLPYRVTRDGRLEAVQARP